MRRNIWEGWKSRRAQAFCDDCRHELRGVVLTLAAIKAQPTFSLVLSTPCPLTLTKPRALDQTPEPGPSIGYTHPSGASHCRVRPKVAKVGDDLEIGSGDRHGNGGAFALALVEEAIGVGCEQAPKFDPAKADLISRLRRRSAFRPCAASQS